MLELLAALEDWYRSNCDGDWEHSYGLRIQTLDNPGWCVDVDLLGTALEGQDFASVHVERTEQDWLHCRVEKGVFRGAGGPRNLREILEQFIRWSAR
ncbi:MAG: immunity 53 family protein [Planctomycetota bacterium]